MLTPIIAFAVSGLGIVSVIGTKLYQQATSIQLPLAKKRTAFEKYLKRAERNLAAYGLKVRSILHIDALERGLARTNAAIRTYSSRLKVALTGPEQWLDRKTRNLVSLVRGRQQLPRRKAPSAFLQNIGRSDL